MTDADGPAQRTPPVIRGVDALAADIGARLARAPGRLLVGVAGSPGSGKSTVAAQLLERFGGVAALVPMDGFHLASEQLEALGRLDRKGAPDTFDAHGFVALLERCRMAGGGRGAASGEGSGEGSRVTVYAPRFVREIEESFGSAIAVPPSARLVLTEGNYLLIDAPPWSALDRVLDVRYHLAVDDDVRRERLVARHVAFGKTSAAARAWASGPDEANATLIEAASARADAIVRL
jgi:pantothenate kinase